MRLIATTAVAIFSAVIAAAHGDAGREVFPVPPNKNYKTCTVLALGNHADDTPQILKAFSDCNHGGTVVFPKDQVYWIATRMNPIIYDVTIDWHGIWTFSDDLTYWRNNSYPVAFQNHAAGFIITGDRIHITGEGGGGINGNGNAWYDAEKAVTQPGRPMPFVFWNITCHGGNGIAIGSLGQYLEDASAINITVKDVKILTHNLDMHNSAYIKTWMGGQVPQSGYESAGLPRGGGWGNLTNLLFENFHIEGAALAAGISQDSGNNGSYTGTSKFHLSDITFRNFTGFLAGARGTRTASVSCSNVYPCFGIEFENFNVAYAENVTATNATGTCSMIKKGGVEGILGSGCS
ncbi:hypothetical protein EYC80_001612 [Monilinia laxa]|uniref:galacturonan 1,4-alpha-galacturonidase n=1 Tax=Monilinia laxa TaxID=61186 RepID=A0A5N6K5F9_MONLA|nr:hypothetical protein EYC80_001612 [Monilinia laxa]